MIQNQPGSRLQAEGECVFKVVRWPESAVGGSLFHLRLLFHTSSWRITLITVPTLLLSRPLQSIWSCLNAALEINLQNPINTGQVIIYVFNILRLLRSFVLHSALFMRTASQSEISVLIERAVCQRGVPLPLILPRAWVTDRIIY